MEETTRLNAVHFNSFGAESRIFQESKYYQTSNIRHTKSPNLNVSRLILQLSLPNPLKPVVKSRMKM